MFVFTIEMLDVRTSYVKTRRDFIAVNANEAMALAKAYWKVNGWPDGWYPFIRKAVDFVPLHPYPDEPGGLFNPEEGA